MDANTYGFDELNYPDRTDRLRELVRRSRFTWVSANERDGSRPSEAFAAEQGARRWTLGRVGGLCGSASRGGVAGLRVGRRRHREALPHQAPMTEIEAFAFPAAISASTRCLGSFTTSLPLTSIAKILLSTLSADAPVATAIGRRAAATYNRHITTVRSFVRALVR